MNTKTLLIIGILASSVIAAAQSQAPYAPGELIVKFPEKSPMQTALSNQVLGSRTIQTLGSPNI